MDGLKKWMQDSANILFDDSKNDLRSLPKAVRLQILLVLSFIWTTVFSLYVFSYTIPYDGPSKSVFEKWLPFSKDK